LIYVDEIVLVGVKYKISLFQFCFDKKKTNLLDNLCIEHINVSNKWNCESQGWNTFFVYNYIIRIMLVDEIHFGIWG